MSLITRWCSSNVCDLLNSKKSRSPVNGKACSSTRGHATTKRGVYTKQPQHYIHVPKHHVQTTGVITFHLCVKIGDFAMDNLLLFSPANKHYHHFYSLDFIAYSINLSCSFSLWILTVPKQQRLHLPTQHTYICTANTCSQTLSHLGQHNLCCWRVSKGKRGLLVHGVWQMNQIYELEWQRHRHTLPSPTGFRRKVGQTDVGQSSILESTTVKFGWDPVEASKRPIQTHRSTVLLKSVK